MFSRTKSHAVFTLALALLLTASIEFRLQSAALASAGQNLPLGAATPFKKMFFALEAQQILAGDAITGRPSPSISSPGRSVRPERISCAPAGARDSMGTSPVIAS